MKSNLLKTAAVVMAVATLTACSKGSSKKSNTELLTKAAWKLQTGGLDADKNGTVDLEDSFEACELDNLITFVTGGTGTVDEGPTKCDPADDQSTSFAWQFKNDEKEIEFDGESYKIYSIDDTNLKIYFEETSGGTTVRYLFILKH